MDRIELEAKVVELVETAYKQPTGSITLATSFKDDLGGASVQMVALIAEIENELDASVMLQNASACDTVADLVNLVEQAV